ncbi:Isochorismatase family protein [Tepidimonas thermarum]|uniref:Isochorismatase family protein n=1 Tax=Tepidimonas thermarum TaxID=335431 RepID=A0A554X1U1_9BURK|nr:isochorismatase family protein [Tepidimonas thermarum]TSE29763.1 Isochorismatase family protein [Tepidimonas thermarum]
MLLDAHDCQLVLVDYQERLMPAIAQGAQVLQRAHVLAGLAALLEVPVWGTEQVPQRLGPLVAALRPRCRQVFAKTAFDACGSGLLGALRGPARPAGNARSLPKHLQKPPAPARQTVVLAGCEAHVCVLQTALGLLEHDFDVWVVTDACGSRHERDRDAALDRLAANGVELVTTEMVGFEWLRDADHPRFREALALLK